MTTLAPGLHRHCTDAAITSPWAEPADRLILHCLFEVELAFGDHVGDHRCLDRARTHCVDADAARGAYSSAALRVEADDSVLGRVVRGPTREADEAAQG